MFTLPAYRGLPLSHAAASQAQSCAPRAPVAAEEWAHQGVGSEPVLGALQLATMAPVVAART